MKKDFPDMEGDFFYYDPERPGLVHILEAGYIHQTVRAFEGLMHKHGLWKLVDQMSQKGQDVFYLEVGDDR